ncbi:hypothetical protein OSTOST_11529 [Ostertagia ostertagi]
MLLKRHITHGMGRTGTIQIVSEKQGCINVTDSSQLQLGCSRKWMHNEYEEVMCACETDNCNRDDLSASAVIPCATSMTALIIAIAIYIV